MQVSVETTQGLERRLTMTIPREKIDSEIQTRLQSLTQKTKIDGFRPGKVPLKVVKNKYGQAVQQEVMGELMQSTFYEAITQEKLRPAGYPHIEPTTDENIAGPVEFSATFEVYPEITLTDMSSIAIEQPMVEIGDADVDDMIETVRKQKKVWTEVDREVKEADKLTVDFEGKIEGELFEGGAGTGMSVEIGSNRMIPGFEEKLIGMKPNEERDIDLKFPDDYHSTEVAGKPVTFHIKLTKLEEATLPEINDAFAVEMGIKEGGLVAFKESVKTNMAREAEQTMRSRIKQNAMDALIDNHEIEVPKILVDNEIDALMNQRKEAMGQQALELKAEMFEEEARRRVALGLILSEVIKENDLKVEPAKLRETVEGIAAGYDSPDEVVKYYYSDKERLAQIENFALEQSVVDWILDTAVVSETSVGFKEMMNRG